MNYNYFQISVQNERHWEILCYRVAKLREQYSIIFISDYEGFTINVSGLLLDSFQYLHISLVLGSPEVDTAFQIWHSSSCVKIKILYLQMIILLQTSYTVIYSFYNYYMCHSPEVFLVTIKATFTYRNNATRTRAFIRQSWVAYQGTPMNVGR